MTDQASNQAPTQNLLFQPINSGNLGLSKSNWKLVSQLGKLGVGL
jgi:hypothetical protein